MMTAPSYQTIRVRFQDPICFLQLYRPEAQNTINDQLLAECSEVLDRCEESTTVLVIEGLPETFCFGADFTAIRAAQTQGNNGTSAADFASGGPEPLYDLWQRLTTGPYVVISHVRGKANAGGVGFVAASDIVIADDSAVFSLSELLFGLMPACVLPFLSRRVGWQKAHYMTLMTHPISVSQAVAWGLVDAHEPNSDILLRRHLSRLKRLNKTALARYKRFASSLSGSLVVDRQLALAANKEVFSDPRNIENIVRYVEQGIFPWEFS
ncbi:enoyl-CoA hydratase/isomerase [Mycoavidus sp. HKI]|uniref:enoyl-CoA hydratase/isomerase n=1 Tax=Mycoavidus sp. HKI TaxID=2840467 RepID=UPI001CC09931|nr:enoyl-CoA hydratase/isomerase [Mycoavidus sp. HKI]UAW64975.1 enoyl-CoA hydratase/isomerase [Mycoavidus sp. HKI]